MLESKANAECWFIGQAFPCPVCGMELDLRRAKTGKPYCVCDMCGIQLFIRGEAGIRRLRELLESLSLTFKENSGAGQALALYNRLQLLRTKREDLESSRAVAFSDSDLENVVAVVDKGIAGIRIKLGSLASKKQSGRKKK